MDKLDAYIKELNALEQILRVSCEVTLMLYIRKKIESGVYKDVDEEELVAYSRELLTKELTNHSKEDGSKR